MQEAASLINAGILHEAVFLGASILVGAGLFFVYDLFRIFRRLVPHGEVWIGVEDFFYWLLCTVAVFLLLYQKNDGMIRGFALGGVVIGMLLYFCLPSRFVIRVNVCIWGWLLRQYKKAVHRFLTPVGKRIWKIFHFFWKQLKKVGKMIRISIGKL